MPGEGSQHFMKNKFPEFSLIIPWESSKIHMCVHCVLYSQKPLCGQSVQSVNEHNLDTWHKTTSQSMNTTWTHGTRRTYTKLAKTFPWWVPDFWCPPPPPNSRTFPWLENWKLIFKVFPDFQWNPAGYWRMVTHCLIFSSHFINYLRVGRMLLYTHLSRAMQAQERKGQKGNNLRYLRFSSTTIHVAWNCNRNTLVFDWKEGISSR